MTTLHKSIMFMAALVLVWLFNRPADAQESPNATTPPLTVDQWQGAYFNNPSLSGEPVLTRTDAAIDFDWQAGSPAPDVLPVDGFSVRWTGAVDLEPGRYRFTASADDGFRLWVNELPIFDNWTTSSSVPVTATVNLPAGISRVRVEYFENTGNAAVQLDWEPVPIVPLTTTTLPPTSTPIAAATPITGTVVNAPILNVRNGPGVEFARIATLRQGQTVTVIGRNAASDWAQIQLAEGQGWVSSQFLATGTALATLAPAPSANTGGAATGTVLGATPLNVRSGPSLTASILQRIAGGATVTLQGRNRAGDWLQVQLADGQTGWVSAQFVQANTPLANLPLVGENTASSPSTTTGNGTVVNATILNVRAGPAVTATRLTTLPTNQAVNVVARNQDGSWLQIQLADGRLGWVNRPYIQTTIDITTLPVRA